MQLDMSSNVVRKSEETSPFFVPIFSLTKSGFPDKSAEILCEERVGTKERLGPVSPSELQKGRFMDWLCPYQVDLVCSLGIKMTYSGQTLTLLRTLKCQRV